MLIVHLLLLTRCQVRIGRACWLTHARLALGDDVWKHEAASGRLQAEVDLECTCSSSGGLSLGRTRHLHDLRVTVYDVVLRALFLRFVRWLHFYLPREVGAH